MTQNTTPELAPRRKWQVSLRMLFFIITAFGCWLGLQLNMVRERQSMLRHLRKSGTISFETASSWIQRYPPGVKPKDTASVPMVRVLLGDEAVQEFWFTRHTNAPSPEDLREVARLFPEATVNESYPEPCHPGCFPAGTLVETPQGRRAIESIQVGDIITTMRPGSSASMSIVESVFRTRNELWRVVTESGELVTTRTQPIVLPDGGMRRVGDLQPGDTMLSYRDGEASAVKVVGVFDAQRSAEVFNLVLDGSEVFVAGDFLVRGKPPAELGDGRVAQFTR